MPTGILFRAGSGIKLTACCFDDEPETPLQTNAAGRLEEAGPFAIKVYHNAEYPSYLLVPITRGNFLGTFMGGGKPRMRRQGRHI